jgi:adenylate cyclase
MTELKLRLQEGTSEKMITVHQDTFTIGRLPQCDLSIASGGVSRFHARLTKTPSGTWTVEDLGSKNGTQLNENLVTYAQPIRSGDIIWLGDVSLVVLLTPVEVTTFKQEVGATAQGRTILRNVKQLQEQWLLTGIDDSDIANKDKTIARLKDLVDIAKNLSAAASIQEIFSQVQEVVFRYLNSIDRLALLIDVSGSSKLELVNAATRDFSQQEYLLTDSDWISRSICQKVFEEKVAIQTADAQNDERFAGENSILVKGIRSAMAVPSLRRCSSFITPLDARR